MGEVFYMKNLIEDGRGAFTVHRFVKNTEEGSASLRDILLAAADWSDATLEEWDNYNSAVPAVAGILLNEEWAKIEHLAEDQKKAIRGASQGMWTVSANEPDTAEASA